MTNFQKFMIEQSVKMVVSLALVEVAGISLGIIMATEPWDHKTDSEKKGDSQWTKKRHSRKN